MRAEKIEFGTIEGRTVYQYVLENDQGMEVKIMEYGATITSISVPCNGCKRVHLVCGFDTLEGYLSEEYKANAPYFGSTVGRYAGRIKDGQFTVNGENYQVVCNNGSNHLHGGILGFDKQVWKGELLNQQNIAGVKMSLTSPHMQEGYPGKLEVSVSFLLTRDNELEIEYEAVTDKETPLSLTNHTYFNLNGFSDNIRKHFAMIQASKYQKPDDTNVPVGEVQSVEGEASDLRKEKVLHGTFEQLETGFEHYYIFDKEPGALESVALFKDPEFSRTLEVKTNEPGMLFYTGYYTSDLLKRESGEQYGQFRAFCCETGRYLNGPNISDASGSTLKPGEVYHSKTVFAIQW